MARVFRLLLLLSWLLPRLAAAAPPPPPKTEALFRQHHARALQLYQARRYEESIAALQAAYALRPDPRLHLNLGHAYRRLGRGEEAIAHYSRYRQELPSLSPEELAAVEEYLALARQLSTSPPPLSDGEGERAGARSPAPGAQPVPSPELPQSPATSPVASPASPPAPSAAPSAPSAGVASPPRPTPLGPSVPAPGAAPEVPPAAPAPAAQLAASLPLTSLARPGPSAGPPLHRRWWFWGILGVAAAGVVTAAVLSTQPWDANLPPGAPIHDPKF